MTTLERTITLSAAERMSLKDVPFELLDLKAGERPSSAEDQPSRSFVVLEGVLSTSKTTWRGDVSITAFHVPGDMLGLQGLHLDALTWDLQVLTDCRLACIAHSNLESFCERHPRLSAVLWRAALVDGEIAREWLVNIGQRPAINRAAHLLCEMMARMEAVGLAHDGRCTVGMTQQDVGEATGLSKSHVGRTLRELCAQHLITFGSGELIIHDQDALARLGEFQADYLHLPGVETP